MIVYVIEFYAWGLSRACMLALLATVSLGFPFLFIKLWWDLISTSAKNSVKEIECEDDGDTERLPESDEE